MAYDYRDFGQDGKKPEGKPEERADLRWWLKKGQEQADAISHALTMIDRAQSIRMNQLLSSARLYGNTTFPHSRATGSRLSAISGLLKERLHYNATQSILDTAIARLTRDKPTPYHLTSGGNFHTQRKAKKLNELRDGIFHEQQTYRKGELAARDGAIFGDGLLWVFEKDGRVCHERGPATEFFIDEMEAMYGSPRSGHRVINVDRDVLRASWPKKKAEISDANAATQASAYSTADVVMLRESWHLPSGPEATDGAHVISIAGEVLFAEKWKHDFFPCARFSWCPKPYGFWSQGLCEQLQPMQLELNKLLRALQISYERACYLVWLIENGSKVNKAHIQNEIGLLCSYTSTKPEVITPPVAPPEVYGQIETLIRRMREQAGLNEMSVQGSKPQGVDSGKAMRTMDDIENVRFTQISHAYEQFYIDVDKITMAVAHDIAEQQGDYEVRVPGKRAIQSCKWSQIDLAPEEFTIHVYPVSSLPDEPEGRLQTIQEYVQAGMMPPDVGMKLLEFPDVAKYETLQNAMEDRLQEVLDAIVDEGEYSPPEPHYNMERADKLALQYLLLGESQDLEPERLEMLRRFRSQIAMLQQMAQPAPAANQAPGGMPPANPTPTPQSGLIPNVNQPGAAA